MSDNFQSHQHGFESPADRHIAITPSDSAFINPRPRALWCQTAGSLALEDREGNVFNYSVTAGQILPFRVVRVLATGTTPTVYGWE